MNDDYCEISTVDGTGSPITAKTYKQCICRNDFSECSQGTEALPIDQLTPGVDYCKEISANGNATIKYAPGVCMCNASQQQNILANDGYIETDLFDTRAQTTYKSNGEVSTDGTEELKKDKLSPSNQNALERLFLQECGYQKNGSVKGDGCGRLYYKCKLNPSEYPYYGGNCEAPKVVTTSSTSGGWDGTFTMYKSCDCPDNWYSQDECDQRAATVSYKCLISGQAYKGGGYIKCSDVGGGGQQALKIYGDSCIKEDGTEVKKYCECNRDVFTYKKTGVYPYASCIDGGPDDRINQVVYVCYFDDNTAKNVVCPSCQGCSWNNVNLNKYHVSRSFDSK